MWLETNHANRIAENLEYHTTQVVCLCLVPIWRWAESPTEPNQWLGVIALAQRMQSILMNFKELIPGCIRVQTLTLISEWHLQWRSHKSITLTASLYHQLISVTFGFNPNRVWFIPPSLLRYVPTDSVAIRILFVRHELHKILFIVDLIFIFTFVLLMKLSWMEANSIKHITNKIGGDL